MQNDKSKFKNMIGFAKRFSQRRMPVRHEPHRSRYGNITQLRQPKR